MLDGRIKLRHLRCFFEAAQARSVGRAAAVLHISQPAATKTIQELEDLLGVALFDRSRRRLTPTPEGEAFFRHAGASLTALRQGLQSVAHSRAAAAEAVSIGALPTVSARVLPEAVALVGAGNAGLRLRVVTGPNAHLLALLRQGDLDLIVGRMGEAGTMTGLAFEHLYSEPIALVVRAGHPLLRTPFALPALLGYEVLLPPADAAIHATVARFLVMHGLGPPPRVIETVSLAFGRGYVRRSDAVWIISEGVVIEDLDDGLLCRLPVDTADTSGPVGLTTRADLPLPVAAQRLAAAIRTVTARLGPA